MQSLANKTNSDYYFANGSAGLGINALDADAKSYISTSGATDIDNINTFIVQIKAEGLWSGIKCFPLRTTQNATSTTAYSFGGLGSYTGTLTSSSLWATNGVVFTGTARLTMSGFIDCRKKSVMSFVNAVASGVAYNSYFGFGGAGNGNVLVHVSSSGGRGLGVTQPNLNIANDSTTNGTGSYCVCYTGNASSAAFTGRTIGGANKTITGNLSVTSGTCNLLGVGWAPNNSEGTVDYLAHTCSMVIVYDGQLTSGQQDTIYNIYKSSLGQNLSLP